ncbi:MAG: hypothetical protein LIR50_14955 [Bacillota bacterium]|nr:hypothetical protein [Bacillota bacterium]
MQKATKIMKFLKENNAIIEHDEDSDIFGTISNKKFSISAYTGVKVIR